MSEKIITPPIIGQDGSVTPPLGGLKSRGNPGLDTLHGDADPSKIDVAERLTAIVPALERKSPQKRQFMGNPLKPRS